MSITLLSVCEFSESRCSEDRTLLLGVQVFLSVFSTLIFGFLEIRHERPANNGMLNFLVLKNRGMEGRSLVELNKITFICVP
jgi:hypothetical protein